MIRAIVAIDEKRGMANDQGIPWDLPTDKQFYRDKTAKGAILRGYGTYLEFKSPFHGHLNYVATTKSEALRDGFEAVHDAREFIQNFKEDMWVIGGAGLLAHTLDLMDELVITQLRGDFNCTKFFPEYDKAFELVSSEPWQEENGITFRFTTWKHK